MITDYFKYQSELAKRVLVPAIEEAGQTLSGKTIIDIGCAQGGVLSFLSEYFDLKKGVGIDIDSEALHRALEINKNKIEFSHVDFLKMAVDKRYDFVLFRDVLEHIIEVDLAFEKIVELTDPEGMIYISYAPFFSPFGGHQHNGSGIFSNFPWIQVLPEFLFRKIVKLKGNAYKQGENLERDMESVLATRLTVKKVQNLIRKFDLKVVWQRRSLVRPDYEIKFHLKPLSLPKRYLPFITEALCTGDEFILKKR